MSSTDLSKISGVSHITDTIELHKEYNTTKCKCEAKCEKNHCPRMRKCLTVQEVSCLSRDAVINIHSEFILLGASGPGSDIRPADISLQPLASNARADIILKGNGFFIEGHYIIAPAHLVLLPPSLTSVSNRYPFFEPQIFTKETRINNLMVRASRILVTVFNVNNKKHSFIYEAELLGVDGAGDIAVLYIKKCSQWNFCNPIIEDCHPYLMFGCSRKTPNGEKVYLLGNSAVSEGLLCDNQHIDHSGLILAETILVSGVNHVHTSGLPILDCRGYVIGMQTTRDSYNKELVCGPSQSFMNRVIKALIVGSSEHLQLISDPIGNYHRYRKAYLGIAYEVLNGTDYDVTTDYNSSNNVSGVPRIRLDANGEFMNSPSCKEIMGIKVLGLAGANKTNDLYYVPGGESVAPLLSNLCVSPLLAQIQPGDILTHINDIPIGDLSKQLTPALILWRHVAGQQLTITYRSGGNFTGSGSNDFTDNYDNLHKCTVFASDYPLGLDYPWYAIDVFPSLSALPYPGFVFNNQLAQPQLPQLANSQSYFRPSI